MIPEMPPEYCALERAPFVAPASRTSDRDGNALDDVMERRMAACLVPEFRFDSAENNNPEGIFSLRRDEPNVLFSAHREGADSVRVDFVALFRDDGGFVLDDGWPLCGDAHPGDSQRFSVTARVVREAGAWFVVPVGATELAGSHTVVYASAGKHHFYGRPTERCYGMRPFGCCRDRADGAGARVVPGSVRGSIAHVPALWDAGGQATLPGFQGPDLANLGYPGRTLTADFYSPAAKPPGQQLLPRVQRSGGGGSSESCPGGDAFARGLFPWVGLIFERPF